MRLNRQTGFTLIEVVIVIVILGLLSAIAIRQIGPQIDTAQSEQTKKELDQLALAIVGNPALKTNGARTDFGYVGDIGALPLSLSALVVNPGGFATWAGPYIDPGPNGNDYLMDAWQSAYIYSGNTIRSVGGGTNIDKPLGPSTANLLTNTVEGYLVDAGNQPPGPVYMDSVLIELIYPDGSGGLVLASRNLNASGNFSFSSVPVGNHSLRSIHLPTSDTTTYQIVVEPGSHLKLRLTHPADIW